MSLAHRIIPCLDTDGGRVVKGVNFVGLRDAGDPVALAARYNDEGADELVVLDIAASRDRRSEEHTSELQSRFDLVCRLLLEKKHKKLQPEPTQVDNVQTTFCMPNQPYIKNSAA